MITIEGLGTNLVGCYGGAIAPTKNWDRLASKSIVMDQFWADALRPVDVLHSLWSGSHFAARKCGSVQLESAMQLQSNFLEKILFATDSLPVLEESDTKWFGDILYFESDLNAALESQQESEDDSVTTQVEQLFQAAIGKWSAQLQDHPFLWIHSSGLNGPWDAPYAYRQIMCDEGDPEPPLDQEPAELQLTENTDPDDVFGHSCSAGGQAIAMDEAWALLQDAIEELGIADECLLILAGVSGYPMGEHGWVGNGLNALFSESIHLPLVIRPGNRLDIGHRLPFIVQPHQLIGFMNQWLFPNETQRELDLIQIPDLPPAESWPIIYQCGFSVHEHEMHLVVPAWSYRWSQTANGEIVTQLYAMPDDRWQQNEVSQRAGSTVEILESLRGQWLTTFQGADIASQHVATSLPQELTHPFR